MPYRPYLFAAVAVLTITAVRYALTPLPPPVHDVTINQFRFNPDSVIMRPGEHVHFKNVDQIEHVIRSGSAEHPTDTFRPITIATDSIGVVVLKTPGRYPYFCERHAFMKGEISVIQ